MKFAWAIPGAKCVALVGVWHSGVEPATGPSKGEVCTVAGFPLAHPDGIGIPLAEYPGPDFSIVEFRPVIDQSDDVALFAHHLDQNSIHVSEPA